VSPAKSPRLAAVKEKEKKQMASASPISDSTLQVRRVVSAPRERVYAAWTEPDRMKKWFLAPDKEYISEIIEVDLRVGGRLRAKTAKSPAGPPHRLNGVFREVKPLEKLVFTWSWEGQPEMGESLVTVEFRQLGESTFTEVVLTHELFPNKEVRDQHNQGWIGCLDRMVETL